MAGNRVDSLISVSAYYLSQVSGFAQRRSSQMDKVFPPCRKPLKFVIRERTQTLVYCGSFFAQKGLSLFKMLKSFSSARQEGFRYTLALLGDGPTYKSCLDEFGTTRGIRFLGRVGSEILDREVGHARAGLLPYSGDALAGKTVPNKLTDYTAAGLPVIATRETIAALRSLVREDVFIEWDFSNPRRLLEIGAILDVSQDYYRHQALACFERLFSMDVVMAAFVDHCEELMDRCATRR